MSRKDMVSLRSFLNRAENVAIGLVLATVFAASILTAYKDLFSSETYDETQWLLFGLCAFFLGTFGAFRLVRAGVDRQKFTS